MKKGVLYYGPLFHRKEMKWLLTARTKKRIWPCATALTLAPKKVFAVNVSLTIAIKVNFQLVILMLKAKPLMTDLSSFT